MNKKRLIANTAPNVHSTALKLINNEEGKILDLAAGSGAFLSRLNPFKFKRFACELDKNKFMLKDVPLKAINLNEKWDYKNKEYDIISAIEIIEHLENPWHLIREIHRIMKDKGILILSTPNVVNWYSKIRYLINGKFSNFFDEDYKPAPDHITPIFPKTIEMIIKNKFKIEKIKYNRGRIPFFNINFTTKNSFFGEIAIYKMRKI